MFQQIVETPFFYLCGEMRSLHYDISVIMPVYRVEGHIEQTLSSLAAQTFRNFELILVDDRGGDASIDKAVALLEASELKDDFRVVENPSNLGVSLSRGRGLEVASGEYVIHLDSDDFFEPDMLEIMYRKGVEEGADIVVCGFVKEFGTKEEPSGAFQFAGKGEQALTSARGKEEYIRLMLENSRPSALWNKLVKRELYTNENIGFDQNFRDDLSVSPLLILAAKKIAFVELPLVHYVMYNSASVSASAGHLLLIANTLKFLEKRFEEEGVDAGRELFAYKNQTRRRLLLHKQVKGDDVKKYLKLFPEINGHIISGNNPEKKYHYRLFARLAAGGDSTMFRLVRFLLRFI